MSEPNKDPYPIAPTDPPAAPPPSASAAEQAKRADLKAKLQASSLLEGFEEDADFDKDPELEARILGKSPSAPAAAPVPALPEFIQPGVGQPKHWAIIGAVLVVGALVAAGINAPNHTFLRILLTLYKTLVNTGTGMVALYLAARLLEHRFGSIEAAASRMLTCVGVFMVLFNLNLHIFGDKWASLNRGLIVMIAMAGYGITLASTLRLWDRQKLGFVAGFHALLWMVVEVGMQLAAFVDAAPARTPG